MKKLKIIWALIKWLYGQQHKLGIRYTVNRTKHETWFLVEPAWVMVSPIDDDEESPQYVTEDGKRYIRVGGGEHKGKLIYIGDAN